MLLRSIAADEKKVAAWIASSMARSVSALPVAVAFVRVGMATPQHRNAYSFVRTSKANVPTLTVPKS
jgi:hypothetical protein